MPVESITIPVGDVPVVAKVLTTPAGVILATVPRDSIATNRFPVGSITILRGFHPVVASVVETPRGVIFDIVPLR